MSTIKRQLYEYCVNFLAKRIEAAQEAIRMAQDSANDETKSSAGDKYETGRAMMQLEIEKNATQLEEAEKQMKVLKTINIDIQATKVQNGSLVTTSNGTFLSLLALGWW